MGLKKKVEEKIKKVKELKKSTRPFKNYNFLTEAYKRKQQQRHKQLLTSTYETPKEKKYGNQFQAIAKQSFKEENIDQKFRLSHVYQLGIDFQILFIYSKKDIGKTRQLGLELTNIKSRDPGAHVVFIRNSKEELRGGEKTMNDSQHGPTGTNGEHVGWKDDIKKKGKSAAKPCGFMAYASGYGFLKGQGSEFDNVKFWMWDECNSVEGGLTDKIFNSVNVFLSSLIRDKQNVKGFMMGNLLDKNNIFLNRLGVGSHTRLKLFNIHEDDDKNKPVMSRLLYLNTGDLYKGIEQQKGLATHFLKESEKIGLLTNRPGFLDSKSQYEALDLKKYKPIWCFVGRRSVETIGGRSKKSDSILYLYGIPNTLRYVCGIDTFDPDMLKPGFPYVFCYQREVANTYTMTLIMEKEDFGESFIEPLAEILDNGELGFGWNDSQDIFEDCGQGGESKFLSSEDSSI